MSKNSKLNKIYFCALPIPCILSWITNLYIKRIGIPTKRIVFCCKRLRFRKRVIFCSKGVIFTFKLKRRLIFWICKGVNRFAKRVFSTFTEWVYSATTKWIRSSLEVRLVSAVTIWIPKKILNLQYYFFIRRYYSIRSKYSRENFYNSNYPQKTQQYNLKNATRQVETVYVAMKVTKKHKISMLKYFMFLTDQKSFSSYVMGSVILD